MVFQKISANRQECTILETEASNMLRFTMLTINLMIAKQFSIRSPTTAFVSSTTVPAVIVDTKDSIRRFTMFSHSSAQGMTLI